MSFGSRCPLSGPSAAFSKGDSSLQNQPGILGISKQMLQLNNFFKGGFVLTPGPQGWTGGWLWMVVDSCGWVPVTVACFQVGNHVRHRLGFATVTCC